MTLLPFPKLPSGMFILNYTHRFFLLHDDERWVYDCFTLAKKHAFAELGQRLYERR